MPNEPPTVQRVLNNISFFLLGVTALGTVLDSANNAIDIITPTVTWFGIGAVILTWLVVYGALKFRAVTWRTPDNTTVRPVSLPTGAKWAGLGVICLLVLPRLIDAEDKKVDSAALLPPPRASTPERTTVFVFLPNSEEESAFPTQRHRAEQHDNVSIRPSTSALRPAAVTNKTVLVGDISEASLAGPLPNGGFLNPRFFARSIDGRTFTSKDFTGKAVVVYMWATWCAPCLSELPRLAQFAALQADRVILLSVAEKESPMRVRAYARNTHLSLPLIPDEHGILSRWFPGTDIPRTYVVAPNGQIVLAKSGTVNIAELEDAIARALATRPAA